MSLLALLVPALLAACSGGGGGSDGAPVPVSLEQSSLSVGQTAGIPSDGVASTDIAITLRDAAGAPLPGVVVACSATGAGNAFWPAATATTDGQGRAQVRMSSTQPGSKTLAVEAGVGTSAPVQLAATPTIDFVEPSVPRERVSVSSAGDEASDFSGQPAVSGDGRFVAFQSKAPNLVPGDTNEKEDVFVRDLETRETERVSLTPSGGQFPDLCGKPSLSDDGRFVAFEGRLADDDAIWLRDRQLGSTQAISDAVGLDGRAFAPAISGDGRWIAFVHTDGESQQVWVVDRLTLALELGSRSTAGAPGDEPSWEPALSRDGRWLVFRSTASNLVADDSNDKDDVFLRDRQSGVTRRVSLTSAGAEAGDDSFEPAIAADGRWVVFASKAEDLVPGDDNGKPDVFLHDLATGATERVSLGPQGQELDEESWKPAIDAEGRFVVFSSLSGDVVPGDANGKEDVFRRELATGSTIRVSLAQGGGDPDQDSTDAALAVDAPVVAFTSKAQNLVPSDENDTEDVFVAPR